MDETTLSADDWLVASQNNLLDGVTELQKDVDEVSSALGQINENVGFLTSEGGKIEQLSEKVDVVGENVSGLTKSLESGDLSNVDYTDTLQHIGELLALSDVLMVLLSVMLFFACGLAIGKIVTDKLYGRN